MISEVYRSILSAHIQSHISKVLFCSDEEVTSEHDTKHSTKATQYFLKANKWNVLE